MELQITKAYLSTPRTPLVDYVALVQAQDWKMIAQTISKNIINFIHNPSPPDVINPTTPTEYSFHMTRDMTVANINSVIAELKKILIDSKVTMETAVTNPNLSTTVTRNYIKISWS